MHDVAAADAEDAAAREQGGDVEGGEGEEAAGWAGEERQHASGMLLSTATGSGSDGGGGGGGPGGGSDGEEDEEEDELDVLMAGYEAMAAKQARAATGRSQQLAGGGGRGRGRGYQLPGMVKGREAGLAMPLPSDNVGAVLMAKMGYVAGRGLGKGAAGRAEPLVPQVRDRSGLGVHEGKKRARDDAVAADAAAATQRAGQANVTACRYQASTADAYKRRRVISHLHAAWRAAEQLERAALQQAEEARRRGESEGGGGGGDGGGGGGATDGASDSTGLVGVDPACVPLEFGGTQPAPPTVRAVGVLRRLSALWVPRPDGDGAADAAAGGAQARMGVVAGSATAAAAATDAGAGAPAGGGGGGEEGPAATGECVAAAVASGGTCGAEFDEPAESEELSPEGQLEMLLCFLRSAHVYCHFCGCAYDDDKELARSCPGPGEDDH
ncbi:hypothetical protein FOA52_015488 [Chlamydomonas sp. UWO 241]|nr:hypothetical protein FOA52_015488 [Chlamydomonas sp. UWO 241]